jgi:hypothetical protein
MKCFCKLIWVILIMQENFGKRIWASDQYAKDDMRVTFHLVAWAPSLLQGEKH